MKKLVQFVLLNFLDALREKLFVSVIFFFLILLGLSFFLSVLSVGESTRVLRGSGLSVMEITGLLLIIISFTFSFYRDKTSRMLEIYLSYVPRYVYTASKVLAYVLIVLCYLIVAGLFWGGVLQLNSAFFWNSWAGIFSLFLKLCLAVFLCLFFCTLCSSPTLALLSTIFIYFSGSIVSEAVRLADIYFKSPMSKTVLLGLSYTLPNLDKLDLKYQLIYGQIPGFAFFGTAIIYTVCYCLFLWSISTWFFSHKK
ncbi:MAG: hypothetical protein PHE58_07455 [Candidatus Omnitrophica bacterium]|nr:hypothetical protein [Candidatus Omnitrophota bacterium]